MDFCLEAFLYERFCRGCPKEKECHDKCEHCDDYLEELDRYFYDNDEND